MGVCLSCIDIVCDKLVFLFDLCEYVGIATGICIYGRPA